MKPILFILLVLINTAFITPGNDCFDCKWGAEFDQSDIQIKSKLVERVSANIIVSVENIGTCVWKKNEVYLNIKVMTKPPRSASVSAIFKEGVKHPLYIDNIANGETGVFRITFNPLPDVPEGAQYGLQFTLMYKGKVVGSPVNKYLKYED